MEKGDMGFIHRKFTFTHVHILLAILLIHSHVTQGYYISLRARFPGPYCASRPPGQDCCYGRDDECSVPIHDTECYCDNFCNSTARDCCPDYFRHCLGFSDYVPTTTALPTPRTTRAISACTKNGKGYQSGDIIKDNCNTCTCELYTKPYSRYEWKCTNHVCLIRPEIIDAINDGPYTWKARNQSKLWGLTLDDGVRYRLGTFQLAQDVVDMTPIKVPVETIPERFDARERWPGLIHPITDQGNCGSSWAHSTTAVLADRLSIETDGAIKDQLSVQHLLSCNTHFQTACEGGHLDRAWWYLRKHGVVSEECYPYTVPPPGVKPQCLISGTNPRCPSGREYNIEKRFMSTPPYRIRPSEREIMIEIIENGPVQAVMLVKEDFFLYSHGIYRYTNIVKMKNEPDKNLKSGVHSVRIIGWGVERNFEGDLIKYWICANSWGTDWGEKGYFRILRGGDESQIEDSVIGVWGRISGDEALSSLLLTNRRQRNRKNRRDRRHLRARAGRRRQRREHAEKHNLNKIESYMELEHNTGRKYRDFKSSKHRILTRKWNKNKKKIKKN